MRFVTLFLMLACIVGCQFKSPTTEGIWFYTYDATSGKHTKDPVLTPASFIYLANDGNFTAYLTEFEYGTWRLEGKAISITNNRKETRKISLRSLDATEMKVDINPLNEDSSEYVFERNSGEFKKMADNPFAIENNKWRIAATHKESDAEITNRLINHFRYWEKYFSWGLDAGKTTMDVRSLRGPLKLYGNGFTLVPFEDQATEWKSCFFDEEDAQKAFERIQKLLREENISWPQTDNRYKMFISAFQQLQQKLQKTN